MTEQTVAYRYERQFANGGDWEEVTEEYVRDHLDGPYRDVNKAMDYLHENGLIRTPFAYYRATKA